MQANTSWAVEILAMIPIIIIIIIKEYKLSVYWNGTKNEHVFIICNALIKPNADDFVMTTKV